MHLNWHRLEVLSQRKCSGKRDSPQVSKIDPVELPVRPETSLPLLFSVAVSLRDHVLDDEASQFVFGSIQFSTSGRQMTQTDDTKHFELIFWVHLRANILSCWYSTRSPCVFHDCEQKITAAYRHVYA